MELVFVCFVEADQRQQIRRIRQAGCDRIAIQCAPANVANDGRVLLRVELPQRGDDPDVRLDRRA